MGRYAEGKLNVAYGVWLITLTILFFQCFIFLIKIKLLSGGGQIFRNSISLSVILKKALTIHSIRSNRPTPGLHNVQKIYQKMSDQVACLKPFIVCVCVCVCVCFFSLVCSKLWL
jgi:hypothetical protein